MSVVMKPGATTLTVMLRLASSRARVLVKSDQAGFARGVIGLACIAARPATEAILMMRPAALPDHGAHDALDEIEGALEVGVDDDVPILLAHAHGQAVAGETGVVDQNIDAPEVGEDSFAERGRRLSVGDIDRVGPGGVGMAALISSAVLAALASVRLTQATWAPRVRGGGRWLRRCRGRRR